jgi:hypothetical protein
MCPESRHHSKFNSEHCNWEGLCDHFWRKSIFTLISYNFCTSTPPLTLEMTSSWFIAIAIQIREFPIQSSGQNWLWSWKCPRQGHAPWFKDRVKNGIAKLTFPEHNRSFRTSLRWTKSCVCRRLSAASPSAITRLNGRSSWERDEDRKVILKTVHFDVWEGRRYDKVTHRS